MDQKIMLFGVGLIGNALLMFLLGEKAFPITNIIVSDQDERAFSYFDSCGGVPENRFLFHMDRGNYTELLSHLTMGDFFVCLAEGIDHCVLMEACLQRGIHFICSSSKEKSVDFDPSVRMQSRFSEYLYEESVERYCL